MGFTRLAHIFRSWMYNSGCLKAGRESGKPGTTQWEKSEAPEQEKMKMQPQLEAEGCGRPRGGASAVLSKAEELGVPCGALQQEQACTLDSLLLGCPSLQVPRLLDGSAPFRVVLYSAHRPTYTPTVSGNLLSDPCRNMLYPFSTQSPIQ